MVVTFPAGLKVILKLKRVRPNAISPNLKHYDAIKQSFEKWRQEYPDDLRNHQIDSAVRKLYGSAVTVGELEKDTLIQVSGYADLLKKAEGDHCNVRAFSCIQVGKYFLVSEASS
jgi:hypothetical protein